LAKIKVRKVRKFQQQRLKDEDSPKIDTLQAKFASFGRSKFDCRQTLCSTDKFEMSG